jgi:hypothetical protein
VGIAPWYRTYKKGFSLVLVFGELRFLIVVAFLLAIATLEIFIFSELVFDSGGDSQLTQK